MPAYTHPLRAIWYGMIGRCHNKKNRAFKNYGARGITVCDKWRKSFDSFVSDVGSRPSLSHSIDRFPNRDGNYEPGNVRWATPKQQGRNSNGCTFVTWNGESRCLTEWADLLNLSVTTIKNRHRSGQPLGDDDVCILGSHI